MAIDTATKRLTAIGISLPFRGFSAVPDGSDSASDRLGGVYLYSGIVPEEPVPSGDSDQYTLSQFSLFTPPSSFVGLAWRRVAYSVGHRIEECSGRSSSSDDVSIELEHTIAIESIEGDGWIATTAGIFGLMQKSSISIGTILVRPLAWTLTKKWPTEDSEITGVASLENDSIAAWEPGDPTYELSFEGVAYASGPLIQTAESVISLTIPSIGTISFAGSNHAVLAELDVPMVDGGYTRVRFAGRWENLLSFASDGIGADMSWLFKVPSSSSGDEPPSGEFSLAVGGGETIDGSLMLSKMELGAGHADGGMPWFRASMLIESPL